MRKQKFKEALDILQSIDCDTNITDRIKREISKIELIEANKSFDLDEIIQYVGAYFSCDPLSTTRKSECVMARNTIAIILRLKYGWNLSQIGKALDLHHSSIIHGLKAFANDLQINEGFYDFIFDLVMHYELKFNEIYKLNK